MTEVSVLMPCLNEAGSVGKCVEKVLEIFGANEISGEVIVIDNGSSDLSGEVAMDAGAKVVFEPHKGYGNAYLAGLKVAKGQNIIMVDPDGSYDLREIPRFLKKLEDYDLVIGNRFYKMQGSAMPFSNRLWNVFLRFLLHSKGLWTEETCTGFVGIRKEFVDKLGLKQPGMEFSSELLLKAARNWARVEEIPIVYHRRIGKSKVNKINDGLRHLKFILSS